MEEEEDKALENDGGNEGGVRVFTYDHTHLRLGKKKRESTQHNRRSSVPLLHETGNDDDDGASDLDNLLLGGWEKGHKERGEGGGEGGVFRYSLPQPLPFKVLPPPYSFLLQLNPERGVKRRVAEEVSSLSQPFNPGRFHFNRVSPKEVLFHLHPTHWQGQGQGQGQVKEGSEGGDVLINVSPLEWGHVLLVPDRGGFRPQRLTYSGLRLALELALLSTHPGLKLGFNSLCGYASVNHEHYHAYYLSNHTQYLQHAKLLAIGLSPTPAETEKEKGVDEIGGLMVYEIVDYPAQGCVWVLEDVSQLEGVVGGLLAVGTHLQTSNIAHNLFITRGSGSGGGQKEEDSLDCLRIFLWARESSYGAKESDGFNPALCELAGHFPCKSVEAYDRLTEDGLVQLLRELTAKPWAALRQALVQGSLLSIQPPPPHSEPTISNPSSQLS